MEHTRYSDLGGCLFSTGIRWGFYRLGSGNGCLSGSRICPRAYSESRRGTTGVREVNDLETACTGDNIPDLPCSIASRGGVSIAAICSRSLGGKVDHNEAARTREDFRGPNLAGGRVGLANIGRGSLNRARNDTRIASYSLARTARLCSVFFL